jgi:hypothetical protein
MSKFERLLEAGSTELPDCRCTAEMHLMAIVPVHGGDTEIRVFRCLNCSHELRLTAWRNDVSAGKARGEIVVAPGEESDTRTIAPHVACGE